MITAGSFWRSEVICKYFGATHVDQTMRLFRKHFPGFPSGRKKLNQYTTAHFIYVICATTSASESLPAILYAHYVYSKEHKCSAVSCLGDFITDTSNLERIEISTRNGDMEVFLSDGTYYRLTNPEWKNKDWQGRDIYPERISQVTKIYPEFLTQIQDLIKELLFTICGYTMYIC